MGAQEMLLAGAAALLLAELARSHRALRRALERRPPPPEPAHYPSLTVIRPIKGLDTGAEANLRAALDNDYPGWVETLFVFDDAGEPALEPARRAIAERRAAGRPCEARIVISGEPPTGRTGKLHAMIAAVREARGALLAFADSDTRADPKALRTLVATLLAAPRAGSAFAPVVAVEEPATLGDAGYALLLNGLYGPVAAATERRNGGELPFVMGQYSVYTREALAAIGGLECAEGQLVDDMYLGARIKAAGFRNVVAPRRVPIIQRGLSLGGFWRLYVRWLAFSRSGLPALEFKLRAAVLPILFWLGLVVAIVALSRGWPVPAALGALVPLGVASSTGILHRTIGGGRLGWRVRAAPFLLLLVAPVVAASVALRREIEWRGRRYRLDARARLDVERPAPETGEPVCWEEAPDGVPVEVACTGSTAAAEALRRRWRTNRPRGPAS
ncbi:MAG: glycosyltransferase [Deltaproteobacteria bacterium]|nr:glycosyltransferase [Deltaproteobacteria bacterium]